MVYLDKDTKRKYKAQCALEGVDMSANAALLIENWLKERDRTNGNSKTK
ncbi:hypothetical protein H6F44_21175 [Pseudanabaena sp. FACHB-1277]|uniref:Uncharacterized protein n=2 Tax=Pseudanabaena TaxID=1152 RepID=A0A926UXC6_9CYAN|nr:hypothetical protein [Pseudanabaena cinerea FACHB-1277]